MKINGLKEGLWELQLKGNPTIIRQFETYKNGVLDGPGGLLNFDGTAMMYTYYKKGDHIGPMVGLDSRGYVKWVTWPNGKRVSYSVPPYDKEGVPKSPDDN